VARILVADDDAVIRRLLGTVLKQDRHEALFANDGEQAWNLLCRESVDMAILDLAMPRMTGLDVLERVRGDSALSKLPVIILTASGQESDESRAALFKVSLLRMKPFSSRDLRADISRLLAQQTPRIRAGE
jgi:DNA-binding response OmpR family regulator